MEIYRLGQMAPERLQEIWWVRRMPQLLGGCALLVAVVLPLVVTHSSRHLTYATILAFAAYRVWRTRTLRQRFGSEYDRTLEDAGSRRGAESDLKDRERRRRSFDVVPLSPASRDRSLTGSRGSERSKRWSTPTLSHWWTLSPDECSAHSRRSDVRTLVAETEAATR